MSHDPPQDDLFQHAKQILQRVVGDEDQPEELLIDAFYLHDPLLHGIEMKGAAGPFASKLIKKLLDYGCLPGGEHSLARLLQTARNGCGVDQHAEIDELICMINADHLKPLPAGKPEKPALEAEKENLRTDKNRVLRGGLWFDYQDLARAVYRDVNHPEGRDDVIGFRVVLSVRPPSR